jgi:hypothetical protein
MITKENSKDLSERISNEAHEINNVHDSQDSSVAMTTSEKILETVSFEKLSFEKTSVIDQGKNEIFIYRIPFYFLKNYLNYLKVKFKKISMTY